MAEIKKRIELKLPRGGSDILIGSGLLGGEHIAPLVSGRAFVVADENSARHHLEPLAEGLKRQKIDFATIVFKPGEKTKSIENLEILCRSAIEAGLTRDGMIIALGGGVIGDLAGFAASILLRGVDFVQIPTTLLAQVDSSVGGKTAVNLGQYKNMIGSFYQPKAVLIDIGTLKTLPMRELKSGYAEIIKYGILGDVDFFNWLEENGSKVLALDDEALSYAIFKACNNKAAVVLEDERERGLRRLLNLGHTFAHAYESYMMDSPGALNHGEAVALGVIKSLELSCSLGMAKESDLTRVLGHMTKLDLLKRLDFPDKDRLLAYMKKDKKTTASLNFVLCKGIGKAFFARDIDEKEVLKVL